jgi:hypothetical protein
VPPFRLAAAFHDQGRHPRHQAGLVQTSANDHHRDDRHHRIGGKSVKELVDVRKIAQTRQLAEQAQQHHHHDRSQIDAYDFRDKEENGERKKPKHDLHLQGECDDFHVVPPGPHCDGFSGGKQPQQRWISNPICAHA